MGKIKCILVAFILMYAGQDLAQAAEGAKTPTLSGRVVMQKPHKVTKTLTIICMDEEIWYSYKDESMKEAETYPVFDSNNKPVPCDQIKI